MKFLFFSATLASYFLIAQTSVWAQVKFIYDEDSKPTSKQPLMETNQIYHQAANSFTDVATESGDMSNKEATFVIYSQPKKPSTTPNPSPTLPPSAAASVDTEPVAPIDDKDTATWQIKVYPPNDVAENPDLVAFTKQLLIAVKEKDIAFIKEAVHPDIEFGEVGNYRYGKQSFLQTWQLSNPNSPFWLYLEKALKIGGGYYHKPATDEVVKNEWVFPYICNLEIDPALMYSDVLVVTSDRANVRSKPDLKAPVVAKLRNDIVKVNYAESVLPSQKQSLKGVSGRGERDWYRVSSLDNKINGYINWLVAWNPRGLRLHITQSLDKWYINAWIGSGD